MIPNSIFPPASQQHCSKSHKGYIPLADRSENVDDRDDDDDDEIRETVDARDGTDGQTVDVLPEIDDASQKEPKRRYGSKEPKAATSKRRQKDSVEKQDTGAKKAKSKAAPAKKLRPAQFLSLSGQLCESQQELSEYVS